MLCLAMRFDPGLHCPSMIAEIPVPMEMPKLEVRSISSEWKFLHHAKLYRRAQHICHYIHQK